MNKRLLHIGNSAYGLASIIPFFVSFQNTEIYFIDDDTTFENQNRNFFWSNLKLHKYYLTAPELGNNTKEIKIDGVVDCYNFDKIKALLEINELFYLSLDLDDKEFNRDWELIKNIISYRLSLNYNQPLVILNLNYLLSLQNLRTPVFSDEITGRLNEHSHYIKNSSKVIVFDLYTDILCSLPINNNKHDKCVVHQESREINFIVCNRNFNDTNIELRKVLGNFNKVGIVFTNSLIIIADGYFVATIYRYLLAIVVNKARHLYVYGYMKFSEGAKLITAHIITELAYLFKKGKKKIYMEPLINFHQRLVEFGSDVTEILPLKNNQALHDIYIFLSSNLDTKISEYNKKHVDKIKLIPEILKLLYKIL